jgi:hypothetical protein
MTGFRMESSQFSVISYQSVAFPARVAAAQPPDFRPDSKLTTDN